jgi:cytosine/adenosine deaminase-related metal-dependent hydrolase
VRLISAPWVFPISAPPLAEGAVVLDESGGVVAVGPRAELRALFSACPEERAAGALLPGLVNAHTHLELSALGGLVPGGRGFVPWAVDLMAERERLAPETVRDAAVAAALSTVAAGTAAVGDVAGSLRDAVPAIAQAGLGGVLFHELYGSREARTGDAIADAAGERDTFEAEHGWPAGLGYVLAPHAPYSVGAGLFRRIFATAAAAGRATSVHVAEDEAEIALLTAGTGPWPAVLERLGVPPGSRTPGVRPVRYLASLGAFETPRPPLLVHMVWADQDDLGLAGRHRAPVVLCPRSNLHIAGRVPDVPALLAAGVPLCLGTDSLASCSDLSLWSEMHALAARFPQVAPGVWLTAATAGGAAALGLPALGALAPGKRPGVLDVELPDPAAPLASLVSTPSPRLRWISRP